MTQLNAVGSNHFPNAQANGVPAASAAANRASAGSGDAVKTKVGKETADVRLLDRAAPPSRSQAGAVSLEAILGSLIDDPVAYLAALDSKGISTSRRVAEQVKVAASLRKNAAMEESIKAQMLSAALNLVGSIVKGAAAGVSGGIGLSSAPNQAAGKAAAMVKEVVTACDGFTQAAKFVDVDKARWDKKAEGFRKLEDDLRSHAQSLKSSAERTRESLRRLIELKDNVRQATLGRA